MTTIRTSFSAPLDFSGVTRSLRQGRSYFPVSNALLRNENPLRRRLLWLRELLNAAVRQQERDSQWSR